MLNMAELAATLSLLKRWEPPNEGNYTNEMQPEIWGDYIRADDIADIFGLLLDPIDEKNPGFRL